MTTRSRVELYEQIRKAHDREEVSIRELARRFRVHRRDVRRALESPLPPPRQAPLPRPSLLDEWKPTIDAWLEADRTAPPQAAAHGAAGVATPA
jgi:transposase